MHKDNESASNPVHGSNYLIRPHRGGFRDLFRYGVRDDERSKEKFLERPENGGWSTMTTDEEEAEDHRWVIVVSILVRKIIRLLRTPMEYTGFVIDFFLNLLSANGGFFGLGSEPGKWTPESRKNYNLLDAVSRHTVQVYPKSWSAILLTFDNAGMWNIRTENWERRYLGEQLYVSVLSPEKSLRDVYNIPLNTNLCGIVKGLPLPTVYT